MDLTQAISRCSLVTNMDLAKISILSFCLQTLQHHYPFNSGIHFNIERCYKRQWGVIISLMNFVLFYHQSPLQQHVYSTAISHAGAVLVKLHITFGVSSLLIIITALSMAIFPLFGAVSPLLFALKRLMTLNVAPVTHR